MARYIGPKCKLSRREGTDLYLKSGIRPLESKCNVERPPGMHRAHPGLSEIATARCPTPHLTSTPTLPRVYHGYRGLSDSTVTMLFLFRRCSTSYFMAVRSTTFPDLAARAKRRRAS